KKTDDAVVGYDKLVQDGFSPGVLKPFVILVEGSTRPKALGRISNAVAQTPGINGVVAPPAWRKDRDALIEAFSTTDAASDASAHTISKLQHDVLPGVQQQIGSDVRVTLGGTSPEDHAFAD